jgi:hypothetical protein
MKRIRAKMSGTTVVQKLNQGITRNMGVLCFGGPFLVLFWASKKVQNENRFYKKNVTIQLYVSNHTTYRAF